MSKYAGKQLRKGKRVIHILFHVAPSTDQKKSPCGCRHGKYACDINGESKFILTHNISRYVCKFGYKVEDDCEDCWLHAQHALKNQENVTEKKTGLWHRFWNFLTK